MAIRLSLAPLTAGVLSVLLLTASHAAPPDTGLRSTTATLVFTAPLVTGTERTVVVEVPSTVAGAAPVLVMRELDARYTTGAVYQQSHRSAALATGDQLPGRQLPGNPESLVLQGQTTPTPKALVLLAIGLGLLVTRRSILMLAGRSRGLLQDVDSTG
jgi:hypothetical protein